jgi:hypothetical protein
LLRAQSVPKALHQFLQPSEKGRTGLANSVHFKEHEGVLKEETNEANGRLEGGKAEQRRVVEERSA